MNTDDTAARLRIAAEARLSGWKVDDTLSAEETLHELRVHQIELEMQNESLRKAQFALEEAHERYLDLYEFAPVAYLTLNQYGMINTVNLTAVSLLGRDRKLLLNREFSTFLMPESVERYSQYLLELAA